MSAAEIRDWLLEHTITIADIGQALDELCQRIVAAGVPLARSTTAVRVLHASLQGVGREWRIGEPVVVRTYPYGPQSDYGYEESPYGLAHRTGEWVMFDPRRMPDTAFDVIPSLKAGGYTHYVCIPLTFSNGRNRNAITFATRDPGGFTAAHLDFFRELVPALRIVMELRATDRNLVDMLQTYVGSDPHRRILDGDVHRGKVTRIRSALFFSDLRDFTALSLSLPEEDIAELLNRYFDCVVPEVKIRGGEVLKFIGDGILAIFQERESDAAATCAAALAAAEGSLARIATTNAHGSAPAPLTAGIALHYGEAAYGNVGSGDRLDFTVIGRDVNIANRITRLNGVLGEAVLMSEAFATALPGRTRDLGLHKIKGVSGGLQLFAPLGAAGENRQ